MGTLSDLERRAAYLNLGQRDLDLLRELRPVLEQHAESFVASFYRQLLSFEATRGLLAAPEVKERLMEKQREYLLSLAGPVLDETYAAERRSIGKTHERIGLEPRWYLGGYALYLSLLTPVIHETFRHDTSRGTDTLIALQKLIMLDAQLTMESYIERRQEDLEYLTGELAAESRQLASDYQDRMAELRRSEARAKAAEELASIATLVAGLAHEIGTPMGVIQGHAKLLEPAVKGDEARWRLETIQQQIGRISRIIETLLNMARPSTGRIQVVPLEPLLDSTLSFLSEKLRRRAVRVERSVDEVPSVEGDPERLQQLFLNLLLNAIDAMENGGDLSVSLREEDSGEVAVRIRDSGAGIREADLPHIFEAFFTTKEAGHGSGLGLMVAQGIAADHGGAIEVSSQEGKGTEFRVRLPLASEGIDAS